MNCQNCKELIFDYIEGLLDDQQKKQIELHLDSCLDCKNELEQTKTLQNRLIADGNLNRENNVENDVMNKIFREQALMLRKNENKPHFNFWRIIMKNSITKLAVAALVLIAAGLAIYYFIGEGTKTCCAWPQIADKVEQFKTCMHRLHLVQNSSQSKMEFDMDVYISSDFGNRSDTFINNTLTQQNFVLPKEKTIITVTPATKKYMRMLLTEEYIAKMKAQGQDPRDMVKKLMSGQYTELGKKVIDGRETQGIKVVDPPATKGIFDNLTARIWVDVATELPVQIDYEIQLSAGDQKMQISMVMDNFQWGIDLGPEIFEPNIPSDYTMLAEMQIPSQNEPNAIEGLRIFAEIADGNYPSQMNMMTMMQEVQTALAKKNNLTASSDPEKEQQLKQQLQKMMKAQGAAMFYNKLVQDGNDPNYYGKDVKAGDANSVLMSWKISDDTYRIIYGDLSAENISAEKMKEMEQAAQQ